jgi:plastocyanin
MRSRFLSLLLVLLLGAGVSAAEAQITIERTAQLSGGWVAAPGALEMSFRPLFIRREGDGLNGVLGVSAGFGVIPRLMVGADLGLPVRRPEGTQTEWQLLARYKLLDAGDDMFDVAVTGAYNTLPNSFDGELTMARWFGPARMIGIVRGFSDAFGEGRTRFAIGGGAVVHPLSRRVPFAIAGDVLAPTVRRETQDPAWSVAAQAGLFATQHTVSVFLTNGSSQTLQGSSVGLGGTRLGLEFTMRLPAGRPLGMPPARSGAGGVVSQTDGAAGVVTEIRNFNFIDRTIEVAVGATIEWHNDDNVVHTVNADDGSWRSGAIRANRSWRATFNRPGRYSFYCGPHPYMRGVVIVR